MERKTKVNNLIDHFERIHISQIHLRVRKYPIFNPLLKTEEISAISGICDAEVGSPQEIDLPEEKLKLDPCKDTPKDVEEDSKQTPPKEDEGVSANDIKEEEAMESKNYNEKVGWVSKQVKDLQIRTSRMGEKKPTEPRIMVITGGNTKILNSNNIRDKLEDILRKHCFKTNILDQQDTDADTDKDKTEDQGE
ncbi:hypothetical protein KR067_000701 [Drosophila pandora]|nr:hypothetical protein KR067_000701 [Drosophila pandora]